MNRKEAAYNSIILFSALSIVFAIVLKLYGFNWFDFNELLNIDIPSVLGNVLYGIMLVGQYILIVGCITRLKINDLFVKMIPFLILIGIFYIIPNAYTVVFSVIILFVASVAIKPKLSTIVLAVINIIIISLLQLALIWLRTGILKLENPYFDPVMLFYINIDQFILLTLLYMANRKVGEINVISIFRKKVKD